MTYVIASESSSTAEGSSAERVSDFCFGCAIVRSGRGMSPEDLAFFKEVANRIWPRSIMTRSSIVLALARIGAESVSPAKPMKGQPKR